MQTFRVLLKNCTVFLSLLLIRSYQVFLSQVFGGQCRFIPSCSKYACVAIENYGCAHGFRLAIYRIVRCAPWSRGGLDPVPNLPGDLTGE